METVALILRPVLHEGIMDNTPTRKTFKTNHEAHFRVLIWSSLLVFGEHFSNKSFSVIVSIDDLK